MINRHVFHFCKCSKQWVSQHSLMVSILNKSKFMNSSMGWFVWHFVKNSLTKQEIYAKKCNFAMKNGSSSTSLTILEFFEESLNLRSVFQNVYDCLRFFQISIRRSATFLFSTHLKLIEVIPKGEKCTYISFKLCK